MEFAFPIVLLLLLLLPAAAWWKGARGARPAITYSSLALLGGLAQPSRSRRGRWLGWMRWGALALLVIGLARPRQPQGESRVRASGVDIAVAIDLSGSMAAEDFELKGQRVNRLDIAKDVLAEFIRQRPADRIGLVAFGGRAYVVTPLTLDHNYLAENLERLRLGLIEDNTAIGDGLATALNRLRDVESKSKLVILMTDGQNNAGKTPPLTAAEAAEALGVRVYTIGVGTRGVAPIAVTDAFGRRVYRQMQVDIDEDTLTKIAERTGGRYFRADSTTTLRRIYDEIDSLEKTEVEMQKFVQYRELFPWFVVPGLLLLLAEFALAQTLWRRIP
jgi:Ca-activated chloride channel family protein